MRYPKEFLISWGRKWKKVEEGGKEEDIQHVASTELDLVTKNIFIDKCCGYKMIRMVIMTIMVIMASSFHEVGDGITFFYR